LKDLETESQDETQSSPIEDKTLDFEEEVLPYEGDLLMTRRLLESQSIELEQFQRENLFHTRCKIFENNYIFLFWIVAFIVTAVAYGW